MNKIENMLISNKTKKINKIGNMLISAVSQQISVQLEDEYYKNEGNAQIRKIYDDFR